MRRWRLLDSPGAARSTGSCPMWVTTPSSSSARCPAPLAQRFGSGFPPPCSLGLSWTGAESQAAAHPERASGAIQVEARTGWLQTWHRPPAAHAVTGGPLPSLDAGLWTSTPDTASACGAALVELLTAEAIPRLRRLLDRATLLTTVLDPATKAGIGYSHATIILLVDDGASDQLETALQREEAGQGPTEPELAAWARARAHENERS